eukprot:Phypoly_transcript_20535.p1 GENE.Phypoly_transcript_20535~~Phypoly_transcript_20535.p1  ORF type:complete len:182 (+),score=43.88 Phypoly_transcript_20535:107-652(+)
MPLVQASEMKPPPPRPEVIDDGGKGRDYLDWVKRADPYFLHISDITALKEGEVIHLLFLDRNVVDLFSQCNEEGKSYHPHHFFRKNYHPILTKKEGLVGNQKFDFGEEGGWEKEEALQVLVEEGGRELFLPLTAEGNVWDTTRHWTTLPPSTYVGWRGYSLKWDDLEKIGEIKFNMDKFGM